MRELNFLYCSNLTPLWKLFHVFRVAVRILEKKIDWINVKSDFCFVQLLDPASNILYKVEEQVRILNDRYHQFQ